MEFIIIVILGVIVLLLLLCTYLIYIVFQNLKNIYNKLPQSRIEQDITNIKGNVRKTLPSTHYIYTKDTQLTELIKVMEEIYTIKIDIKNIRKQIGDLEKNVSIFLSHNKNAKDNKGEGEDKEESKAV